jgi:hypothetical protein
MRNFVFAVLVLFSLPTFAKSDIPVNQEHESTNQEAKLVLATRQVIGPNRLPVCFAFHLKPNNKNDSGWVFWSGHEDQEYISNSANTVPAPLESFLKIDPSLNDLINRPVGTAWERDSVNDPWREVPGYLDGP